MAATSHDLSDRELEILRLVATGASNKEIAQKLVISTNTVKVHLRNIFAKVGATSRTEAAMYALNAGILSGPSPSGMEGAVPAFGETPFPAGGAQASEQPMLEVSVSNKAVSPAPPAPSRRQAIILWSGAFFILLISVSLLIFYFYNRSIAQAQAKALLTAESQRWKSLSQMPTARSGLALAVYESYLYAISGLSDQGAVNLVERYDPAQDAWTELAAKPHAVWDVKAIVLGGKIYVPGGRLSGQEFTDLLEIYDPRTDTWTTGASLPHPLSGYALAAFEGKLYLFGGWDGERYLDTVYEYDPDLDQWTSGPAMPAPCAYAGAATAGREIYVLGGYDGKKALSSNRIFAPDLISKGDEAWYSGAPLPEGLYGMGVASIVDMVYVIGGSTGDDEDTTISLQYLPLSDEWQSLPAPVFRPVSHFGLAALGTQLYLMGGRSGNQLVTQNVAYQAIYTVSLPIIR